MEKIVVSKHPAMVKYLLEMGLIDSTTKAVWHIEPAEIKGKHVFGVLPIYMAHHAEMVTDIPLPLPSHKRGEVLSLEEIRAYAKKPRTYIVRTIEEENELRKGK